MTTTTTIAADHSHATTMAAHFANGSLVGNTSQHHEEAGVTEGGIFSGKSPLHTPLALFLVQAVIIIVLSRLIHLGLRKLRQPRVVAEIIGGIALGPSLLGNIPHFTDTIFPKHSLPFLTLIASIGLILYMFLIGLELDMSVFFGDIKKSLWIGIAGILLPFILGVFASYGMYHYLLVPNVNNIPFTSFLLFTGVSMAITAFPVLARILTEFKLLTVPVGMMAISAAAIVDAFSWTVLALVNSILNAGDNLTAVYVFVVVAIYAVLLLVPFRHYFQVVYDRFFHKHSGARMDFLVMAIFLFIFLSSWITEMIGIHAIFGAFMFGLAVPRGRPFGSLRIQLMEKIEDLVGMVFLPLYFASSGLKTSVGLLNDLQTWLWLLLVIAVASFGKIFGCAIAAKYAANIPWRESWSIGILMNTKGLVELIVLNIGLEAKVINPKIFTIMVVMALVTTFMTSPLVALVYPPKRRVPLPAVSAADKAKAIKKTKKDEHFLAELETNLRLLLYVDSMESVPSVTHLLQALKTKEDEDDTLVMHALKIIEVNESSSSILAASQMEQASQTDQALQVASFIGHFIQIPTNSHVAISPLSDYGDEVNRVISEQDCNLLLIPWHYGNSIHRCPHEITAIARQARVTTAMYINWTTAANSSWFNQVKQGFKRGILVPFTGGADDREALKVALRLQKSSQADLCVIYSTPANQHGQPDKNGTNGAGGPTGGVVNNGFQGVVSRISFVEDDIHDDHSALEHVKSLTQTRSITVKEVPDMLEKVIGAGSIYDLIVIGRAHCTADEGDDEEAAAVAGSFAKKTSAIRISFKRRTVSRQRSESITRRGTGENVADLFGHTGLRLSGMSAPILVVSKAVVGQTE